MNTVKRSTPISGPPSLRKSPRRSWISTVDALWLIILMFGTGAVALHHLITR